MRIFDFLKNRIDFYCTIDCENTDIKKAAAAVLAAAALVLAMLLPMLRYFKTVLFVASFLLAAVFPALTLYRNVRSGHVFCEELLIFAVCVLCLVLGQFSSAALVMTLYLLVVLLASYAQMYAVSKADSIPEVFSGIDERYLYDTLNHSVSEPGRNEETARKIFRYSVPAVIFAVVLFGIIIPLFKGEFAEKAMKGAAVLLCFCPFGFLESISLAAFRGVEGIFEAGGVIKDSKVLENLARVRTVICNKTGTVTEDRYTVTDVHSVGISEKNLLSLCARIESKTSHPAGRAICDYVGLEGELSGDVLDVTEIPGRGVIAVFNESTFILGNAALLFENGINCMMPDKNGTAVHLAVNGNYCGYILLENKVRASSYDAIEQLRDCGVDTVTMLSFDLRSIARPVASVLNFDTLKAELKDTDEKISSVRYIEDNKNTGSAVAYIGNAAEEREASSYADVSIATGLSGREECFPLFSMCFPAGGIAAVPSAVKCAKSAMKAIRVNSIVSAVMRIAALILVLCGRINIWAAVLLTFMGAAFTFLNSGFLLGVIKK